MKRALAVLAFLAFPLQAEELAPATHVDLLLENLWLRPGTPAWAGVRLRTDPGWHVYWKNPGESGIPIQVEWRLPPGLEAGALEWPVPERIDAPPVVSLGYAGETVLMAPLSPAPSLPAGRDIALSARVKWMECADVCVPREADVSLSRPVRAGVPPPDPEGARVLAAARFRLPLKETGGRVEAAQDGERIRLTVFPPEGAGAPSSLEFFAEERDLIDLHRPARFFRRRGTWVLDLFKADAAVHASLRGVLAAEPGWRGPGSEKGWEIDVPLPPAGSLPAEGGSSGLGGALLLAFAGGLLLNLMPCVLPVLSLKVLGFASHAGQDAWEIRLRGGLFSAGVIASFWVLAGGLLALRSAGRLAGWGFQLQSPAVVMALAALFFLLALNLFGVFEIGVGWTAAGGAGARGGRWGAFLSGVLATVVATPCTAPFMGSALGYALTRPPVASLAVFTALGAGMAAPYALLSWRKEWLRWVPRPGPWMETLKQFLGFLLAATVVWLWWVFARQTDVDRAAGLGGAFCAMGLGAWIWGKGGWPHQPRAVRWLSGAAFAALLLGPLLWLGGQVRPGAAARTAEAVEWTPYSDARLAELRGAGQPVFVDFTAAWCLSCQVNEKTALSADRVTRAFRERNVAALKGDWTSFDADITRALARHGRSSVPLYLYYPPGTAEPAVLPAVLTPDIVLNALEKGGSEK